MAFDDYSRTTLQVRDTLANQNRQHYLDSRTLPELAELVSAIAGTVSARSLAQASVDLEVAAAALCRAQGRIETAAGR